MTIGRRTSVNDIREIWPTEPKFSDWLASGDGIELLSQDLGIEVENLRREERGCDFPCDLVGNIVGDDEHAVTIENQYGKTNHDHLGKFLTYAATHRALTCVWIAERIADDHRAAVDWLNANTPESFSFFAAELKAYRIGDSPPAPQLDVVCQPNVAIKPSRQGETKAERERHEWRRQFWEEIHDVLREGKPKFRLQKAGSSSWSTIRLGSSDVSMCMDLTPKHKTIGVTTWIKGADKEGWYAHFKDARAQIEAAIGHELKWNPLPGKKSAWVSLAVDIDPKHEPNREQVKQWFCKMVPVWHKVFSEFVSNRK
jgi:hypothetical protein